MEILCNFWLVLEGKIGKEILEPSRLEFLKNFLANILTLLDAEDNTSGPLNRGGIADFNFVENTISNSAASRTLLQQLLACLNFNLESEDLSFWFKRKKVIFMNYGSSKSRWKAWRWMRLDLIFSEGYIHQLQPEHTHKIH